VDVFGPCVGYRECCRLARKAALSSGLSYGDTKAGRRWRIVDVL
jgi:hypothetical protein